MLLLLFFRSIYLSILPFWMCFKNFGSVEEMRFVDYNHNKLCDTIVRSTLITEWEAYTIVYNFLCGTLSLRLLLLLMQFDCRRHCWLLFHIFDNNCAMLVESKTVNAKWMMLSIEATVKKCKLPWQNPPQCIYFIWRPRGKNTTHFCSKPKQQKNWRFWQLLALIIGRQFCFVLALKKMCLVFSSVPCWLVYIHLFTYLALYFVPTMLE